MDPILTPEWTASGHECRQCGSTQTVTRLRPDTIHHAEYRCLACRCRGWLPKPHSDRRPAAHRDLVAKFSQGFCELCLRRVSELPDNCSLEGHHVIEYHDGGTSDRDNVWILCTACHRLVTWTRTYHGTGDVA